MGQFDPNTSTIFGVGYSKIEAVMVKDVFILWQLAKDNLSLGQDNLSL
jgi:hypothetical protein